MKPLSEPDADLACLMKNATPAQQAFGKAALALCLVARAKSAPWPLRTDAICAILRCYRNETAAVVAQTSLPKKETPDDEAVARLCHLSLVAIDELPSLDRQVRNLIEALMAYDKQEPE